MVSVTQQHGQVGPSCSFYAALPLAYHLVGLQRACTTALANTTARSTSSSSSGVALQDGVSCRFAAAAEMRPKSMDQAPPYSQGSTTITASPAAQMRLGTKHSTRVKQQVPFRLRWRSAYLAMARATAQPFPAGEEWNDWMKTVVPYQQRGHTSSIAVLPPSCASGGAESMLLFQEVISAAPQNRAAHPPLAREEVDRNMISERCFTL